MKYKGIADILGDATPPYMRDLPKCSLKLRKFKNQFCVEHLQIVYIMRHLEDKTLSQVARCLHISVALVRRIIDSFVYKKLVIHLWMPYIKCDNVLVQRTTHENSVENEMFCSQMKSSIDTFLKGTVYDDQ